MSYRDLLNPNQSDRINLHANTLTLGSGAISLFNQLEMNKKLAMLLPRLSNAERALLTPASGMMIFNTDVNQIQVYESGIWENPGSGSVVALAGDVSGPSNTNTVDFVGGKTAAQVSTSVDDTLAATDANTASTIMKRDALNVCNLTRLNADEIRNASLSNMLVRNLDNTHDLFISSERNLQMTSQVSMTLLTNGGDLNLHQVTIGANLDIASDGPLKMAAVDSLILGDGVRPTHLVSLGSAPSLANPVNVANQVIEVDSTDSCGSITFDNVAGGAASFDVVFATPYVAGQKPIIILTQADTSAASGFKVSAASNTQFTINSTAAGALAGIVVNYMVIANVA